MEILVPCKLGEEFQTYKSNQKLEEDKIADIMREFMEKEVERINR